MSEETWSPGEYHDFSKEGDAINDSAIFPDALAEDNDGGNDEVDELAVEIAEKELHLVRMKQKAARRRQLAYPG